MMLRVMCEIFVRFLYIEHNSKVYMQLNIINFFIAQRVNYTQLSLYLGCLAAALLHYNNDDGCCDSVYLRFDTSL